MRDPTLATDIRRPFLPYRRLFAPRAALYPLASSRVEERRGTAQAFRFPSPLIERSMRISRTTLSDWFHRGHTTAGHMSVHHAHVRLGVATPRHSLLGRFQVSFSGLQAHANPHTVTLFDKHTRSQGPFLHRRYPTSTVV
jgi:hypothetical protein